MQGPVWRPPTAQRSDSLGIKKDYMTNAHCIYENPGAQNDIHKGQKNYYNQYQGIIKLSTLKIGTKKKEGFSCRRNVWSQDWQGSRSYTGKASEENSGGDACQGALWPWQRTPWPDRAWFVLQSWNGSVLTIRTTLLSWDETTESSNKTSGPILRDLSSTGFCHRNFHHIVCCDRVTRLPFPCGFLQVTWRLEAAAWCWDLLPTPSLSQPGHECPRRTLLRWTEERQSVICRMSAISKMTPQMLQSFVSYMLEYITDLGPRMSNYCLQPLQGCSCSFWLSSWPRWVTTATSRARVVRMATLP